MQLKELQARQGKVDVIVEVVSKDEPKSFNKFGAEGKVCNAQVKDESATMKFTLWNDQIEQVNVGDKIHVTNGYVNEYQGEKQLTTGKFGKLEVVGKSDAKPAKEAHQAPEKKKEKPVEEDDVSFGDDVSEEFIE